MDKGNQSNTEKDIESDVEIDFEDDASVGDEEATAAPSNGNVSTEVNSFTCDPIPSEDDDYFEKEPEPPFEEYKRKPLKESDCYSAEKAKMFNDLREGTIPISCGKCQIYEVKALAFPEKLEEENCWGLTPELLISSNSCIGKKICSLQYVPSMILWAERDQRRCYGEVPQSLRLGYSCLKPDVPVVNVINNRNKVEAMKGLVRSHAYVKRSRTNYPTGTNILKSHTLDISLPAGSADNSYVLIKVLDIDIDTDSGDRVEVSDMTKSCHVTSLVKDQTYNTSTRGLHFKFNVSENSETGKGFEICFQWFSDKDQNAAVDFKETVKKCELLAFKETDPQMFDVIRGITSLHPSGIIQSHPDFPWNYYRPVSKSEKPFTDTRTSVIHVLKPPKRQDKINIWIEKLHMGLGDSLCISSDGKKEESNLRQGKGYRFEGDSLTLNFSILNSGRHTGTGFRICYEWYVGKLQPVENLCRKFVLLADGCGKKARKIIPKKCREKKTRRKKGGKKGGRKGGKKRKKNRRRRKRHNRGRKQRWN